MLVLSRRDQEKIRIGENIVVTILKVKGSTIRSKHIGKDLLAGLRTIVGGEIKEYTEMLIEARSESLRRMEAQADSLGADGVINVRFVTSQVMSGAAELLCYGTAVKLQR